MEKSRKQIKLLGEKRAELADFLLSGRATDWAHYQRIVGKGQGYDDCIEDLQGSLKNDDEEDED